MLRVCDSFSVPAVSSRRDFSSLLPLFHKLKIDWSCITPWSSHVMRSGLLQSVMFGHLIITGASRVITWKCRSQCYSADSPGGVVKHKPLLALKVGFTMTFLVLLLVVWSQFYIYQQTILQQVINSLNIVVIKIPTLFTICLSNVVGMISPSHNLIFFKITILTTSFYDNEWKSSILWCLWVMWSLSDMFLDTVSFYWFCPENNWQTLCDN